MSALESLRKRVIFQNSIDVWIALASDKNVAWNDPEAYRAFVQHLLGKGLNLKAFNLCAHEAGATEQEKTDFVELLAQKKGADPGYATYTIRLTDGAMDEIRAYSPA